MHCVCWPISRVPDTKGWSKAEIQKQTQLWSNMRCAFRFSCRCAMFSHVNFCQRKQMCFFVRLILFDKQLSDKMWCVWRNNRAIFTLLTKLCAKEAKLSKMCTCVACRHHCLRTITLRLTRVRVSSLHLQTLCCPWTILLRHKLLHSFSNTQNASTIHMYTVMWEYKMFAPNLFALDSCCVCLPLSNWDIGFGAAQHDWQSFRWARSNSPLSVRSSNSTDDRREERSTAYRWNMIPGKSYTRQILHWRLSHDLIACVLSEFSSVSSAPVQVLWCEDCCKLPCTDIQKFWFDRDRMHRIVTALVKANVACARSARQCTALTRQPLTSRGGGAMTRQL